jgi:hypothetical protein
MIASLVTTQVTKYFKWDNPMLSSLLLSSVASLIIYIRADIPDNYIEYKYYIIVAVAIIGAMYYYSDFLLSFIRGTKKEKENDEYSILRIYDDEDIQIIHKYISHNKDIFRFKGSCDLSLGDPDARKMTDSIKNYSPEKKAITEAKKLGMMNKYNVEFKYHDTNFDKYVILSWHKDVSTNDGQVTACVIHPVIKLPASDTYTVIDYFNDAKQFVNKKELEKNVLKLWYVKTFNYGTNHYVKIYNGENKPYGYFETKLMDSFFHKEKMMIWRYAKTMHFNPEYFYDFGQSPKLNLLLHGPPGSGKSSMIYRMAMCLKRHIVSLDLRLIDSIPSVYQIVQSPCINGTHMNPRDVIIVFEEFDNIIDHLCEREKQKIQTEIVNDIELKKQPTSSRIGIRDLLDIIQGTISIDGGIIMATTNRFDKIKDLCPELFRPGRLTPIYFGYMENDELQELCKYHFGRELDERCLLTEELKTPTSLIIEKLLEFKMTYDIDTAFNKFTEFVIASK